VLRLYSAIFPGSIKPYEAETAEQSLHIQEAHIVFTLWHPKDPPNATTTNLINYILRPEVVALLPTMWPYANPNSAAGHEAL